MLNIGPQELLIILVIALLVVGPQRLPELGRSIGRGLRELRKAQDEVRRTIQVNLDEPNGDAGVSPVPRPAAGPSTPAGRSGSQDPTPSAGTTPTADEVREISRSLGRSLGQIRRAREEVQRSFRVDPDATPPTGSSRTRPKTATPSQNGDDATSSGNGGTEPAPASTEAATPASDAPDDPAVG